MRSMIQHYNHKKYWKYRSVVIDPNKESKIGNHVKISAGCVVMKDIPDYSIVLPGDNQIVIKRPGEICE